MMVTTYKYGGRGCDDDDCEDDDDDDDDGYATDIYGERKELLAHPYPLLASWPAAGTGSNTVEKRLQQKRKGSNAEEKISDLKTDLNIIKGPTDGQSVTTHIYTAHGTRDYFRFEMEFCQIKCLSYGLCSLKNSHIPFGMCFQPPLPPLLRQNSV